MENKYIFVVSGWDYDSCDWTIKMITTNEEKAMELIRDNDYLYLMTIYKDGELYEECNAEDIRLDLIDDETEYIEFCEKNNFSFIKKRLCEIQQNYISKIEDAERKEYERLSKKYGERLNFSLKG